MRIVDPASRGQIAPVGITHQEIFYPSPSAARERAGVIAMIAHTSKMVARRGSPRDRARDTVGNSWSSTNLGGGRYAVGGSNSIGLRAQWGRTLVQQVPESQLRTAIPPSESAIRTSVARESACILCIT
jgi:hypothetical protein